MRILQLDKKSIVFKMTSFVIILIIIQSIFLSAMLVVGGVISQARQNAFQTFEEKVKNRNDYIQRKMKNKWTNMSPYTEEISKDLSDTENSEEFFKQSVTDLIKMLRATETTGAFIILNSDNKEHDSLYIRDYDPLLNDYSNKDLYITIGSSEIARKENIPLDQSWKYKMRFDENNKDFFEKPYSKAKLTFDSRLLGYWNRPFKLCPDDISIMTYTMPLFDSNRVLRGVIGVEISESYFSQFLPASELQARDTMGYLLGYSKQSIKEIKPIITIGALQRRMINIDEELNFTSVDENRGIYKINNDNSKETIYACVQSIGLYYNNTPFESESWYLIGMMKEGYLLSYVNKIQKILWTSLIISIIIGAIGGYIISYRFTKPITRLVKQVKESENDEVMHLKSIGLTEIDELSTAMEIANNAMLESTLKMSKIIDLAGFPIGAFESNKKYDYVFFTDQLYKILDIEYEKMQKITKDKNLFLEEMKSKLSTKLEGEQDVYKIRPNNEKYVRVKMIESENSTMGVVIDVSKDIIEKNHIKMERDYDPLTMIFNRKAVRLRIENIIENVRPIDVAALVMFDLDNLKTTNDTYGHKWGDFYINSAVSALSKIAESSSVLGRRSGDEFVLFLFAFKDKQSIRETMNDFYDRLKKDLLTFPDGSLRPVSISGGLLWIDDWSLSYDELLHQADELLYKAKKQSKGYYEEDSNS